MNIKNKILALQILIIPMLLISCASDLETLSITGRIDYASMPDPSVPVIVIAASSLDYTEVLKNPLTMIYSMTKAEKDGDFFIDLSDTGASAGTEVFIIALADHDYNGIMPSITTGDLAGFYLRNTPSSPAYSVILSSGDNNITPSGNWQFSLSRQIRDFKKSIRFTLNPALPDSSMIANGDKIFIIAAEEKGLNSTTRMIENMNSVIVLKETVYNQSDGNDFTVEIMNALNRNITDPAAMKIAVYVVHDTNRDGKVSSGDEAAAYWETYLVFFKRPKLWTITADQVNVLDKPVEFINKKL